MERDLERAKKALHDHDMASAERYYRSVLQKEPQNIEALEGLGWLYHLSGQTQSASSLFERCLAIEEENAECLRGHASIALSKGKNKIARTYLEKALSLYPDNPKVESSYALLVLTEGNIFEAEERYLSLSRRFPSKAEYMLGLGESLFRKDEGEKVISITEQALQIPQTPLRYQAMLWALRARAMLRHVANLKNPCRQEHKNVQIWLQEAANSIEKSKMTGVMLPDLPIIERTVAQQQETFLETCVPSNP
jgi:tetratricopeptide (TPR) repeat protein